MATTLLVLIVAWLATIPIVLGLARLLDRMTRPKLATRPPVADGAARQQQTVVPLVPRGRNGLVQAGDLRRAS